MGIRKLLSCGVVAVQLAACKGGGQDGPRSGPGLPVEPAAVTVNGVKLGEAELKLAMGGMGHGDTSADKRAAAVEVLVRQELVAQRAVSLGLDKTPEYREAMRGLEAQLAMMRRRELGRLFFSRELEARSAVGDEEVRAYFDAHLAQLRTQYRVRQIMRRSRAEIDAVKVKLDGGAAFEDVAREGYPGMADNLPGKPWELGPLTYRQLPAPWRPVLEGAAVGSTSGIVEGEAGRFWVLQLVDRTETAEVSFESVAPALREQLQAEKVEAARAAVEKELRAAAKVEVAPAP